MTERNRAKVPWRTPDPLLLGGVAIFLFALATTSLHLWGAYVADARLEHVLAPRQFLARHAHAWDDSRGAGVPALYFSPVVASLQSVLDLAGIPPWLIGRLTITVYLTIAGCGAMFLADRLRPEYSWMPIVSGFLYAFSPFTSQFIIPSGLFVPAAVLPWLILITWRGLSEPDTWRYAARFALVIFAVGLLNTASLLFSLLPVALFALFVVVLERDATWRALAKLAGATAVLTLLVSTAMLTVLTGSLDTVARNISTTELPSTVAQTSSAAESWRGLGFWLTYFRFGQAQRPDAAPFFTSSLVIVLTFVPVAAALVGVATRRVKYWSTWTALMAIGIVVMAGAHRAGDTPLAGLFGRVLDEVTSARAMRSTYKAGTGVALAIALLAPAGIAAISAAVVRIPRRVTDSAKTATTTGVCAVAALAGIVPFTLGWTFDRDDTYRRIPAYWDDFFEMMAEHPDDRVVAFPGASRYRYEWGYVNDNLFDALLAPSSVFVQTNSGATGPYTSVIEELDARMTADDLEPDSLAPTMQLLGARWLLVQRDVADLDIDLPDRLRSAPGVALAATFGELSDGSPALELYRLEGDDPLDATWTAAAPVLVSGGEGTLANLTGLGWLDAPLVNYTALDRGTRDRLLSDGAEIVVSDGAQRRAVRRGVRPTTTVVLPASVEPTRPVFTTSPDDTSTQTVLYTGIVTIDDGGDFERGGQWSPGNQPSRLLDGSGSTGWVVPQQLGSAVGRSVRLRLDRPALLEAVVVSPLTTVDERIVEIEVTVTTAGTPHTIGALLDDTTPTRIGLQRRVDELTITIVRTSGLGGSVGLAELQLVGTGGPLDTTSSLRVPQEITDLPAGTVNPISYVFGRLPANEEATLRRRFTTIRPQEFDVAARIVVDRTLGGEDANGNDPIGTGDDECQSLLTIDGRPFDVRPVGEGSWTDDVIDVEGCDGLVLGPGEHTLAETAASQLTVMTVSLRDVGSGVGRGPTENVTDRRRSSSRRSYAIPPGPGFLSTTVPYHRGWALDAGGRSADRVDTFAGTGWIVGDGGATTGAVRYLPQSGHRAGLAVAGLSLLGCLWLGRRRRTT